jgi:hypothetical protein
MKRALLTIVMLYFYSVGFSQIIFEKGFFINNEDSMVKCFIKNSGWRNNPTRINYKMFEEDAVKTLDISSVKMFSIGENIKYVRVEVDIDKSSSNTNRLSTNKNPIWEKKQLFLKVIIEGNATLYGYENENQKRYFYKVENSPIQQLVYKKYIYESGGKHIRTNARFRQQLLLDMKCENFPRESMRKLDYTEKDLVSYFKSYDSISDESIVQDSVFVVKRKRVNMRFKPGISFSALNLKNTQTANRNLDFDSEIGYQIGVEFEFVLPYNKNKWAIIIEPTYQKYKSSKDKVIKQIILEKNYGASIDYSFAEFPVGLRYNMFLNNDKRLYLGAFVIPNWVLDNGAKIEFKEFPNLKITANNSFAASAGIALNKWSIDINYKFKRNILSNFNSWSANFNRVSLSVGYTLF